MGRKKTIKTIDEVLENSKIDQQPQEENLVKKTCRELGITQKELAEKTGFSENAISKWNLGSKIPLSAERFFKVLYENYEYNKLKSQILKLQVI